MDPQDSGRGLMGGIVGDRNDLAVWFPLLAAAGLPVPRTEIVQTDVPLLDLLDGKTPAGWDTFIADLATTVERVGTPCFLRTGHTSGKHQWRETCHLNSATVLARHVGRLVETSVLADIWGLPTRTWAVRELIPTLPICRCETYGGMPVVREFRLFVRDGHVEHLQPYWPAKAVEEGHPDSSSWRVDLDRISRLGPGERVDLVTLAVHACAAVGGGYWSTDFLQAADGAWWLTDVADGDASYRYNP